MATPNAYFFGNTLRDGIYRPGACDESMIPLDTAYNPNEDIGANHVTTLPTTPKRPMPNSAKRRRQMPDLSRPTATPGHGAKMSMIFRDAATSLHASGLPTGQPSSNIKRSRLPLSQARSIKFGSTGQDDTMLSPGLGILSEISQDPGASDEPECEASEASRHRTPGIRLEYPKPTPFTKADGATPGTLTNQCFGAATGVGGMYLVHTLSASSASLPSQIEEGKEPISSGLATPIAPTPDFVESLEDAKYPVLKSWRSPRSSSNASNPCSDSDDLHSTHGVPFILPSPHSGMEEASRSHIDTWLNGIVEAPTVGQSRSPRQGYDADDLPMNDAPIERSPAPNTSWPIHPRVSPSRLKHDMQFPSGSSSDKENIGPSKGSPSPTRPPAQYSQIRTPSRFRQTNTQLDLQNKRALHFAHPLTPQGHLRLPPKCKRARIDGVSPNRPKTEMPTARRDFTIHEDQLAEALAQLSPDVERHRKGRGLKRERCVSYWDEDILQPGLQCLPMDVDGSGEVMEKGKQTLGELKKQSD